VPFAPGGPTHFARLICKTERSNSAAVLYSEMRCASGGIRHVQVAKGAPDGYTILFKRQTASRSIRSFSRRPNTIPSAISSLSCWQATNDVVFAVHPSVPADRSRSRCIHQGPGLRGSPSVGRRGIGDASRSVAVRAVGPFRCRARALFGRRSGGRGGRAAMCGGVQSRRPWAAHPRRQAAAPCAVTGKARAPSLPDVPTMAEAGFA